MISFFFFWAFLTVTELVKLSLGEYYSFGGSGNNLQHSNWGASGEIARRLEMEYKYVSYSNGIDELNQNLPNARVVSNILSSQMNRIRPPNSPLKLLSTLALHWGNLLTDDLCGMVNINISNATYYPVDVPICDWHWDASCTGEYTMPFYRSNAKYQSFGNKNNGEKKIRTPINLSTSYLDGSFLYGISEADANASRLFTKGLLRVRSSENTDDLISDVIFGDNHMWKYYSNTSEETVELKDYIGAAGFPGSTGFLSGSTVTCPFLSARPTASGKRNIYGLLALRTLFTYEHNRLAAEFYEKNPSWNDQQLYQEARAHVIALVQYITFNEYLPLLIGKFSFPNQITEYNSSLNPGSTPFFCTAAYRFGHSALVSEVPLGGYLDSKGNPQFGDDCTQVVGSFSLQNTINRPCLGVDEIANTTYVRSIICGSHFASENEVDVKFIEEIRSYLVLDSYRNHHPVYNKTETIYIDLMALNIQRGRDHGLPAYNDARELFNLPRVKNWAELTDDEYLLQVLPLLYDDIDQLDVYVGGLIEPSEASSWDASGSSVVGPLFAAIIREQMYHTFAADRLLYQWNETLKNFVFGTRLHDILERNIPPKIPSNISISLFNVANTATQIVYLKGTFIDAQGNVWREVSLLNQNVVMRWRIDDIKQELWMHFILNDVSNSDEGFIGVGFGKGYYMSGKDIIKMSWEGDDFKVEDCYSENWEPLPDVSMGGTNDVVMVMGSFIDTKVEFQWKRPLAATDDLDYPIETGTQNFIVSFNRKSATEKHGTSDRTPGDIDWYSGTFEEIATISISRVQLYHGLTMIVCFLMFYPLSGMIARYFRFINGWRDAHKLIGSLGMMSSVTASYAAAATVYAHAQSKHAIFGVICTVLLVVQVFLGHGANYWLNNNHRSEYYQFVHYTHFVFAITLLTLAPYTCYLGFTRLQPIPTDSILYTIYPWYALPVFLVIFGEIYWKFGNYSWKKASPTTYHIFSWGDIGEKVSGGAAWLIIDGFVYDVTRWQYSHPGGRKVLLDYIGMDCSELFHGKEPVDAHGAAHKHSVFAIRLMSSMVVGEIGSYKDVPPDMNSYAKLKAMERRHSRFEPAQRTLTRTMLNSLNSPAINNNMHENDDHKTIEMLPPQTLAAFHRPSVQEIGWYPTLGLLQSYEMESQKLKQFRVITLTNKHLLTPFQRERPVYLFGFDYMLPQGVEPGEYILLHQFEDSPISRAYTAIPWSFLISDDKQSLKHLTEKITTKKRSITRRSTAITDIKTEVKQENRLYLIIRIYKDGRLTPLLKRMRIGRSLRLTGPFLRKFMLMYSEKSDSGFGFQCWRRIVLICGGTGITPMLAVIMHHLKHGKKDLNKILLIWINTDLYDLFLLEQLKSLTVKYKDRFSVVLFFSELNAAEENEECFNLLQSWTTQIFFGKFEDRPLVKIMYDFLNEKEPLNIEARNSDIHKKESITEEPEDDYLSSLSDKNEDKSAESIEINENKPLEPNEINENKLVEQNEINENKSAEQIEIVEDYDAKGSTTENVIAVSQNKPITLHPYDRIMLSGPSPLVERILETLEKAPNFNRGEILSHIICMD